MFSGVYYFFFFKQKTAYEMRISDWSSDVCSSDLNRGTILAKKPSRRGSSAPTIADVAKRAGVSPMTVSRVINGEQTVRPLTRAAVEDAIRALNYAPHSAARSLAGGGQVRSGLLYSNPTLGRASGRDRVGP